jgi:flagellar biosynthesis protein FlhG
MPLPASANPAPRITAIASGKGGVGKTWFAITLAQALAAHGRRALLFDADLGLANVDIQLGLAPALDLGSVLSGRASLAQAATQVEGAGFAVIAGRSGSGSLAGVGGARLESLLAGLAALPYDDIVLDLGAGLDSATRLMAARADLLLVLATEEPTSLTDAYAVIKVHAADCPGGRAAVVVNQAESAASGRRTYETLARACTRFLASTPPCAGIVRRDKAVRDAIRHQTPLLTRHPGSPAAGDVAAIAARLERDEGAQPFLTQSHTLPA